MPEEVATFAPLVEPIKETAGAHLVTEVPIASAADSAASALARLGACQPDVAGLVWVLGSGRRLIGTVPLASLVLAPANAPVETLMQPPPPTVTPGVDQEKIATLAHAARLSIVPVEDEHGRFLGAVPPLAIIDVLRREHDEDMRRIVGITESANHAAAALALPPWKRVASRLPWLLVGLAGCLVTAVVMAGFEADLQARVAIAFFVPAIVYLADAIGTQTEAIAVRGLSLEHAPLTRLLGDEVAAGALLGLTLGALAFPPAVLLFGDVRLALAVALAIVVAGTLATAVGLFFPWLLSHLGRDPAYGSGPVATIIQDVLSLLVYFVSVRLFVGH